MEEVLDKRLEALRSKYGISTPCTMLESFLYFIILWFIRAVSRYEKIISDWEGIVRYIIDGGINVSYIQRNWGERVCGLKRNESNSKHTRN